MKTRIEEIDELITEKWDILEKSGYDSNVVLDLINLNLEKQSLTNRK